MIELAQYALRHGIRHPPIAAHTNFMLLPLQPFLVCDVTDHHCG